MKVTALIPARGGSKGIPGKNIRPLGGRPLLQWSVEAARSSQVIDEIIVSTDSEEIADVARSLGCGVPFLRPAEYAQDDTPSIDVVLHAIRALQLQESLIVLLQPTSPLRSPDDIAGCVNACAMGAPACVSITRSEFSPFWMFERFPSGEIRRFITDRPIPTRRQNLPPAYLVNGAVYAATGSWVISNRTFFADGTHGWEMPAERSIDIDTPDDWAEAESLLSQNLR